MPILYLNDKKIISSRLRFEKIVTDVTEVTDEKYVDYTGSDRV